MSDNIVFNQILFLVGCGYTVKLSRAEEFRPSAVLRLELSKGDHHHVEMVDISVRRDKKHHMDVSTDYLISRALTKAEWELNDYIELHDYIEQGCNK